MSRLAKLNLLLFLFFTINESLLATPNRSITALPELITYTPEHYRAHKQNWMVRQHQNGFLYFANNSGVLEFDGRNWQLIGHPDLAHVYDFAWSGTRLLVSGFGSFGYFTADEKMGWRYRDLTTLLPTEAKGQYIYRVLGSPQGDFFVGSHFVYHYYQGRLEKVSAKEERFSAIAWVDEKVLLANVYGEVYHYRIDEKRLVRLTKRDNALNDRIQEIKSWHGKTLIVADRGLYWYQEGQFTRFNTEADNWFKRHELRTVTPVSQTLLALGSRRNGIVLVDSNGNLVHRINQASGLTFDRVTQLAMDDQRGLWATHDGGITRIDLNQGLYRLERPYAIDGVEAFAQFEQTIYAASRSKGLYRYQAGSEPGAIGYFTPVSNEGAWSMVTASNQLLVGDNNGILIVRPSDSQRLIKNNRVFSLVKINESLVFALSEKGLLRLTFRAGQWDIDLLTEESALGDKMALVDRNRLLIGGLGKGLWLLDDLKSWPKIAKKRVTNKLAHINFATFSHETLVLSGSINRVNWNNLSTEAHPDFTGFNELIRVSKGQLGRVVAQDSQYLYMVNNQRLGRFVRESDGQVQWQVANVPNLGYQEVSAMALIDSALFLAQLNTIYIFPIESLFSPVEKPRLAIRKLLPQQGEIEREDSAYRLMETTSLTLQLALSSFRQAKENQFRYRLNDEPWQAWKNESHIQLARLPSGVQQVSVQGRDALGQHSSIRTLQITVPTPWYFHPGALFAYLFIIIAGVVLAQRSYYQVKSQRFIARQRELENLVAEKTAHLSELDKVKTEFFCNITHEIRTPLTLNIGNLQYILQNYPLSDDIKEAISHAVNNSKRLMFLVNQILDANRYAVKPDELEIKIYNLNEYLVQVIERFKMHALQQDIELKISLPDRVVAVGFDPEKMERIIFNLMANAFKYTSANGTIELKLEIQEPFAMISVIDTGVGIPPDHLPHLFDRFFSYSHDSNVSYASSGIGLSIVKSLVERQNGSIVVKSQVDEGSCFTVKFPLAINSEDTLPPLVNLSDAPMLIDPDILPQSQKRSEGQQENKKSEDKPTILVVEDNHELRQLLVRIFAQKYNVLEAEQGQSGLQILRRYTPDLVICDVMMPQMSGLEFVSISKSDPETNFIPIFLLTASQNKSNEQQGFLSGADDYIEKPFDIVVLTAKVDNYFKTLENRRAHLASQPVALLPKAEPRENLFKKQIESYIYENMGEMDVNELAKHLKLDSNQLYRRIKKEYDLSPQNLIREQRLMAAASLLRSTSDYVSVIAYQVGFSNLSYFTRSFKEKYGVTPNQYRNKNSN